MLVGRHRRQVAPALAQRVEQVAEKGGTALAFDGIGLGHVRLHGAFGSRGALRKARAPRRAGDQPGITTKIIQTTMGARTVTIAP